MGRIKILNIISGNPNRFLLYYILFLIIPALFINLGLMPFILDEATRANVSLEMIYSGNYIVPTINGDFYYNKPPLFNWIQILFVKLTGSSSEFVFRLPVVISLILFSLSIYQTQKKAGGHKIALFSALAFLSCGRILFYDSFKGLIDISFSWIIYLMFWYIYSYGKRKEYLNLFIVSYFLASLGFLMKGLPSLVFLGVSLLVYFIYTKQFGKLFSLQHLAGFGFLLILTGSYLLVYSRYVPLSEYLENLWSESSKRTFIDNTLWSSIKHLFLFPVDFIYHFLPWTILVYIFFLKAAKRKIRENSFAWYSALIFLFNILVYWVSPAIFPRYLFMFLPLLFYVVFLVYLQTAKKVGVNKYFHPIIIFFSVLVALLIIMIPFIAGQELYDMFYIKYLLVLLMASPVFYLLFTGRGEKIMILTAVLLIARVAFNWFVLPDRIASGTALYQKNGAIVAGELTRSEPLYLYEDTRIHHASTFYIMKTREDILERWKGQPIPGYYYIVEKKDMDKLPPHRIIHSFETRIEALKLYLVKIEGW
ncbi:MAG: ArnT family glycosyltransferase [Bacteroidota bacterium]